MGLHVVELCPEWSLGDSRQVDLIETKSQMVMGHDVESTGLTPIDITVKSVSMDGYIFEWTYGDPKIIEVKVDGRKVPADQVDGALSQNAVSRKLENLASGITFDLETDACGVYLGLRNTGEVAELMRGVLEVVVDEVRMEESDQNVDFEALHEQLLAQFTSEEGMEALIGDDVGLYFGAFGETYVSGESIEYEILAPNAFGGDALPAVSRYFLDDYDSISECGTVGVSTEYDSDEIRRFLMESISDISEAAGGDPPDFDDPESFTIEDEYTYEFCLGTPWLKLVSAHRVISVPGEVRQEITELRDKGG